MNNVTSLVIMCSRIWNETWLSGFFFKPCNYELFVKQSLNMEMAIVFARVSQYFNSLILVCAKLQITIEEHGCYV